MNLNGEHTADESTIAPPNPDITRLVNTRLIKRAQEVEASISLDDIVADLKSKEASAINNEGARAQITYIIEQLGEEEGTQAVEEALNG